MNVLQLVNQATHHLAQNLKVQDKETLLNLKLLVVATVENCDVNSVAQVEKVVEELLQNGVTV